MTDTDRMVDWLRETLDAAQHDAEAAAEDAEPDWSDGGEYGESVTTKPHGQYVAVGPWDCPLPDGTRRHIARHDPAAVLRRIAKDRELLNDLLAEKHEVVEDPWYTCGAATEEHDGGETCDEGRLGKPCDCGRDRRVGRRIRLLAEAWGWTEETM